MLAFLLCETFANFLYHCCTVESQAIGSWWDVWRYKSRPRPQNSYHGGTSASFRRTDGLGSSVPVSLIFQSLWSLINGVKAGLPKPKITAQVNYKSTVDFSNCFCSVTADQSVVLQITLDQQLSLSLASRAQCPLVAMIYFTKWVHFVLSIGNLCRVPTQYIRRIVFATGYICANRFIKLKVLYSKKFVNYHQRNDCFHSPDEDFQWRSKCWGKNNFSVIIDEFITVKAIFVVEVTYGFAYLPSQFSWWASYTCRIFSLLHVLV